MPGSVIVAGARTPIGKLSGALAGVSAADLGAIAIKAGLRMGDKAIVDSMMYDGLFCAFDVCAMGAGTERYLKANTIARDRQDAFAAASHERASAAQKEGRLAEEIVPVEVPQRRGDPILVDTDEGVRPGTNGRNP